MKGERFCREYRTLGIIGVIEEIERKVDPSLLLGFVFEIITLVIMSKQGHFRKWTNKNEQ